MGISAHSRRARARTGMRRFGVVAGLALLTLAFLVPSSSASGVTADVSGVWIPYPSPDGSQYALFASADLKTLTVNWMGAPGPHGGLVGSFQGTLTAGNTYTGAMHVTEGATVVDGTMTWVINSLDEHSSFPEIDVTYSGSNGTGGDFKLQAFLLPARVVPGTRPAVQTQFSCPAGQTGCSATLEGFGEPNASNASVATSAAAQHKTLVGALHFVVRSGSSEKIRLYLNAAGRKLLAKRGTLKVKVVIVVSKGAGLPRTISEGSVVLHGT